LTLRTLIRRSLASFRDDSVARFRTNTQYLPILFYAAVVLAVGLFTGFYAAHNDFWDICFYAGHLDLSMPRSLYNAFFPIGFSLVLKPFMGVVAPEIVGFALNLLCAMILVGVMLRLKPLLTGSKLRVATVAMVAFYPLILHYNTTAGPDPGAMTFFYAGCYLLLKAKKGSAGPDSHSTENARHSSLTTRLSLPTGLEYALAGMFFGLGALWRYHVLLAGGFMCVSLVIVNPKAWRWVVVTLATMLCTYAPQMAVNGVNGLGLLQTGHSLAIYDCMYHINWFRITDYVFPQSLPATIALDPMLFLWNYLAGFAQLIVFAIPVFIYTSMTKGDTCGRVIALFTVIYAIFFGFSVGGRAPLLVLPFFFIYLAGVYAMINERIGAYVRSRGKSPQVWMAIFSIFIGLHLLLFATRDCIKVHDRSLRISEYREVEEALLRHGAISGTEVFTSDPDLYFARLKPNRPRLNSGWGIYGTYGWNQEYPQFDVATIDRFMADCRRYAIHYVVLNEEVRHLSSDLFSMYAAAVPVPSNLREVATCGTRKVYVVGKE
jgi:hypothetical protein